MTITTNTTDRKALAKAGWSVEAISGKYAVEYSYHGRKFTEGVTPTDPRLAAPISTGIFARPSSPTSLAPGLFGSGDVDSDGDIDFVVSGDGDDRLFVILQGPGGTFTTYKLASGMGQAGGGEVTDLDNDGHREALFTSYEKGVVKLYEF